MRFFNIGMLSISILIGFSATSLLTLAGYNWCGECLVDGNCGSSCVPGWPGDPNDCAYSFLWCSPPGCYYDLVDHNKPDCSSRWEIGVSRGTVGCFYNYGAICTPGYGWDCYPNSMTPLCSGKKGYSCGSSGVYGSQVCSIYCGAQCTTGSDCASGYCDTTGTCTCQTFTCTSGNCAGHQPNSCFRGGPGDYFEICCDSLCASTWSCEANYGAAAACDEKQPGATCGSGGTCQNDCSCSTCATCASLGKNCGSWSDGCGGTLNCGTCQATDTDGGYNINQQGTCSWKSCSSSGTCVTSYTQTDSCSDSSVYELQPSGSNCAGNTVSCGTATCPSSGCSGTTYLSYPSTCSKTCSNGACASSCSCTPSYSYCRCGAQCSSSGCQGGYGQIWVDCSNCQVSNWYCSTSCGAESACNGKQPGATCGSGGTCDNYCICQPSGTPTCDTCASLGKNCGSWPDGCGGTLNCGTCGTSSCTSSCIGTTWRQYSSSSCQQSCSNGVCQSCSCTYTDTPNSPSCTSPTCTASCDTCTRSSSTSCPGTQTCTNTDCTTYSQSCKVASGTSCGDTQYGSCTPSSGSCGAGNQYLTEYTCNGAGTCSATSWLGSCTLGCSGGYTCTNGVCVQLTECSSAPDGTSCGTCGVCYVHACFYDRGDIGEWCSSDDDCCSGGCCNGQCSSSSCAWCGDGSCNGGESCSSCSSDCGQCTTFSVTFTQSNVPAGTTWGVTVGGTRYTSTSSSKVVSGLAGTVSYVFDPSVASSGANYVCSSGCSGSVSSSSTVSATYTATTSNTMGFSGTLSYSTGEPVANSHVVATISNASIGYRTSAYNSTNQNGYFTVKFVNMPDNLVNSDFDLSIYVIGKIEAIYECHYSRATRRCS